MHIKNLTDPGKRETGKKVQNLKKNSNLECSVLLEQRKTNTLRSSNTTSIQRAYFFLVSHYSVQNKVNDSKLSLLDACNLFLALDTTFKMILTKWNIFKGAQPEASSHNYIQQAGHLRNS